MKLRSIISFAVPIALLATGAVYVYDASRDDLISEGVTAAGIDLGGMRAAQARVTLRRRLASPLERPLTVRHGASVFTLTAARARLRTDVEGMVQVALTRSRKGNLLVRTVRDLSGRGVRAEVPFRVSYSRPSVAALAGRIKRSLDRPAQDARLSYRPTALAKVPARNGIAVRARELERNVAAELVRPDSDRIVVARTKVTKPSVTLDELAARNPVVITISREQKRLRLFKHLKLAKTYKIAVGRVGFETPVGLYRIQNKAVNVAWMVPKWGGKLAGKLIPGGAPNNPLKARWMGFYDGAGIHGTDAVSSLGSSASHGCIRMAIPEVKELYDDVPVQTPVYIA